MTVGEIISSSTEYLAGKEVETPRLDAELLLGKALGLSRLELYLERDRSVGQTELEACRALVHRRGRREPAAYILGQWGFRRLTLEVDTRALIPRPETEIVVERCLALLTGLERPRILDIGTGSGAIAIALADERPDAEIWGLDSSEEALELAAENVAASGLRVSLVHADFRDTPAGEPFDLVVSNPPYVRAEEFAGLAPEVRDYEPREALVGGTGLSLAIAGTAAAVLRGGGALVLESAESCAAELAAGLGPLGYDDIAVSEDLAGRPRVVEARRMDRVTRGGSSCPSR